MKLVEQKVELLEQGPGLNDLFKHIELCSRTCYKSEDNITPTSAVKFIDRIMKRQHLAMLEHGTVYLLFTGEKGYGVDVFHSKYTDDKYSVSILINPSKVYVTTNLRVLYENGWETDLKYICEPTSLHKKRVSFKITTSIGVARELCRHRAFSFAQESTRYCNYSKDKFDNELTFIIPSWTDKEDIDTKQSKDERAAWLAHSYKDAEISYMSMLNKGATPEQARDVLPLGLKTDICMTGFLSDYEHFIDLRYLEITGKAHPDMKELAGMIVEQLNQKCNDSQG